jgi:glucosamine 6-phosphate synthetase-like amidotransferase/phosphosugar isomerase protein
MCGLFGFLDYKGSLSPQQQSELCNSLAIESEIRGDHATGISYCQGKELYITKKPLPAHKMNFKIPKGVSAVIGHTRYATQGTQKNNINNHPWSGCIHGGLKFAFTHNGVIHNDRELRKTLMLPSTQIETDSFIGVQILENQNSLSFESLGKMAELIQGSFTFCLLDNKNNIYIIKGHSPLSLLHFKDRGLFVYASTDEILWRALVDSPLFSDVKNKLTSNHGTTIEKLDLSAGDIIKINTKGEVEQGNFNFKENISMFKSWRDYHFYDDFSYPYSTLESTEEYNYIEVLKQYASSNGLDPSYVEILLDYGYDYEEIEEMLMDPRCFWEHIEEF